MKIYSMTATFGKLENKTLALTPGLNIIEAPNEWGKSTWCAFLTAMLYGIETRVHTTKNTLADKERYAPWSGAPMSGRIDLNWNGRDITIERSSKGRGILNVFRAYETETGLEIPELTAANCGQTLLGVEKTVFLRAGFLKLADLPVTQDDALRRRLNAIVTTGDESGTADALGQTLRDLKNRCRLNRSTGLLPQAETQRKELTDTLNELEALQEQTTQCNRRLQQLAQWKLELENHRTALAWTENRSYGEKLAAAEMALEAADRRKAAAEDLCRDMPTPDEADSMLLRLRQLRDLRDSLHMEVQMLPREPQKPQASPVFRDLDPQAALSQARSDAALYRKNAQGHGFPWYWLLLMAVGIGVMVIPHWAGILAGGLLLAIGTVLLVGSFVQKAKQCKVCQTLLQRYQPLLPEQWSDAAERYAQETAAYDASLEKYRQEYQDVDRRAKALQQEIAAVTGEQPLAQREQFYTTAQEHHRELSAAQRERNRAADLVQALRDSHREVPAPAFPDTLTYTAQETTRLLSDCEYEQRQLQQRLDNTQGRIDSLGDGNLLRQRLEATNLRISRLEDTYAALELAQSTLSAATVQLQRRFAPKITRRAQDIFEKLTDGRYTRLTLADDLAAHAGTGEESTLRSVLWRSDGTIDQLYLSLRLAVAEALTPDAPLILDDALVRFDDQRLTIALEVLKEEGNHKQVILFTCQHRENAIMSKE